MERPQTIGKCLYTAVKLVFCPGAVVESIANRALRYARAVAAGEVHRRARGQIYRAPPAKTDSLWSRQTGRLELPPSLQDLLLPKGGGKARVEAAHMLLILVIYMYIKRYVQTMRDTTWTDARVETFKAGTNWA